MLTKHFTPFTIVLATFGLICIAAAPPVAASDSVQELILEKLSSLELTVNELNRKVDRTYDQLKLSLKFDHGSTSFVSRSKRSVENNSLTEWQKRIDSKLNKVLNVATEIYKEDKILNNMLIRFNEVNGDSAGANNEKDTVTLIRKSVKEELSVARAEWKGQLVSIEKQCNAVKQGHENVTFLLLGLKDDLFSRRNGRSGSSALSSSDTEPSSDIDFESDHAQSNQWTVKLNQSVALLKNEMQQLHQQLSKSLQRDNRELSDRLITLVNNYEHLKQLRNVCEVPKNGSDLLQPNTNQSKTLKSNHPNESNMVPPQLSIIKYVADQPKAMQDDRTNFIPTLAKRPTQTETSLFDMRAQFLGLPKINDNLVRSASSGSLQRNSGNKSWPEENTIDSRRTTRKPIRPVRSGHGAGRECALERNLVGPSSCHDLWREARARCDGTYIINVEFKAARVYCDMEDGGWTVSVLCSDSAYRALCATLSDRSNSHLRLTR